MSKSFPAAADLTSMELAAPDVSPSVRTDEIDGPLCALSLSLYLSTAEQAARAPDIDRGRLDQALQGAREQLAALASKVDAACQASR